MHAAVHVRVHSTVSKCFSLLINSIFSFFFVVFYTNKRFNKRCTEGVCVYVAFVCILPVHICMRVTLSIWSIIDISFFRTVLYADYRNESISMRTKNGNFQCSQTLGRNSFELSLFGMHSLLFGNWHRLHINVYHLVWHKYIETY